MNCKPGDLAIVLYCPHPELQQFNGRIVRVIRRDKIDSFGQQCWRYKPHFFHRDAGELIAIPDAWLRPIRDGEGTDETLTWAPRKEKEPV